MEEAIDLLTILSNKDIFVNPDEQKFNLLRQHFENELDNGQGECLLELGIGDGQNSGLTPMDMELSVRTAERLAKTLSAHLIHLRDRTAGTIKSSGPRSSVNSARGNKPTSSSPSAHDTEDSGGELISSSRSDSKIKSNKKQKRPNANCDTSDIDLTNAISSMSLDMEHPPTTNTRLIKDFLIRRDVASDDFVDVRVAVVGNVDAGKSTLLGVLTHGELDNGRGLARLRLLRHKHEAESGRTSSVGNDILGFNASGQIVNKASHGHLDWSDICANSAKVITFIDLAGHERYLKTTIFGMTGHAPDYVMFIIGANSGIIGMAKEHLGLALALNLPIFVVITKTDMCPSNILQETMNLLLRILKSPGCRKIPALISTTDDVICCATNFTSERICPIFSVSNVLGTNLDLLKLFLNLLNSRFKANLNQPAHFQIDEIFYVLGVGTVLSGTCISGIIHINDTLLLGPDFSGQFQPVSIKTIQRKRMPVNFVHGGQTASFAMKKLKRIQARKGMVLVACELKPISCIEFWAEVLILHHPTTISIGYQAMVHAGPIRQTATIITMRVKNQLRTGDKEYVQFRFIKCPEYLYPGLRLIFREGKTKAVGTVKEIIPFVPTVSANPRPRLFKKHRPNTYRMQPSTSRTDTTTSESSTTKIGYSCAMDPTVPASVVSTVTTSDLDVSTNRTMSTGSLNPSNYGQPELDTQSNVHVELRPSVVQTNRRKYRRKRTNISTVQTMGTDSVKK